MADAAARLEMRIPSAGWPVSGDSSRKLAARSDQPQLRCTPTPAASTAVAGQAGAGRAVTDSTVMASPRAGPGPAATAVAKDTDPRNPPTLCGHMLLTQVM